MMDFPKVQIILIVDLLFWWQISYLKLIEWVKQRSNVKRLRGVLSEMIFAILLSTAKCLIKGV